MIPTDTNTTTIAWLPLVLTLGVFVLGALSLWIARDYRERRMLPDREWDRLGWWFLGAACGMGGLFLWWVLT